MIFTFLLAILAFSGTVLSQGERNINPCLGVEGVTPLTFKRDWATCASYFWCNGEEAIPSGPCPDNFIFDEESGPTSTGACVIDDVNAPCDDDACPVDGPPLAVGADSDCRSYQICIDDVRTPPTPIDCPTGTLFNRVIGICDLPANVVCPRLPGSGPPGVACNGPDGAPGWIGDVDNPVACDQFMTCTATGLDPETEGNSCGALHFNPATASCDLPENLVPPCTTESPAIKKGTKIETAPVIKQKSFRDRIMGKLHLRN